MLNSYTQSQFFLWFSFRKLFLHNQKLVSMAIVIWFFKWWNWACSF